MDEPAGRAARCQPGLVPDRLLLLVCHYITFALHDEHWHMFGMTQLVNTTT